MVIHELAPADCAEVLSRTSVARLACCRMNQPYVVPVSFVYDPRQACLFSFSSIGKKVEWMRANPSVCVEVEDLEDRFNWTTIVIFGRYSELTDAPEHRDQRHRALNLFSERSQWWLPGAARLSDSEHESVVVYRINIDHMTGRRTTRATEPHSS
jgi:nitroimidazol reductase NimA-like FMN-containing flavoprotein (pyridoxamine 5'-phosphate oxidase superfamily)